MKSRRAAKARPSLRQSLRLRRLNRRWRVPRHRNRRPKRPANRRKRAGGRSGAEAGPQTLRIKKIWAVPSGAAQISSWPLSLQKCGTSTVAAGSSAMSRKTWPAVMDCRRLRAFSTGNGHNSPVASRSRSQFISPVMAAADRPHVSKSPRQCDASWRDVRVIFAYSGSHLEKDSGCSELN